MNTILVISKYKYLIDNIFILYSFSFIIKYYFSFNYKENKYYNKKINSIITNK